MKEEETQVNQGKQTKNECSKNQKTDFREETFWADMAGILQATWQRNKH